MKRTIMRMAAMLFAVALLVGAMPVTNYAATSDVIVFDKVIGKPQQYVTVNGVPRVIYCMQYNNEWPSEDKQGHESGNANPQTKYTEATADQMLLTPDQIEILTKVIFAGYPYNGVGILAPIEEDMGEWADMLTPSLTQAIVWHLMAEWGVDGNPPAEMQRDPSHRVPGNPSYMPYYEGYEDISEAIVQYASDKSNTIVPPESLTIKGSGEMTEDNNLWKTGMISITNPEKWELTYKLELPEGIEAYDADGNKITSVKEGEEFYVEAADKDAVKNAKLKIETEFTYPSSFKQYVTTDKVQLSTHNKEFFQTMACVDVETASLDDSLALSTKSSDDPQDDPQDNPNCNPDDKKPVDTSDNSPIVPFAGLFAASVAGIVAVVRARRRA